MPRIKATVECSALSGQLLQLFQGSGATGEERAKGIEKLENGKDAVGCWALDPVWQLHSWVTAAAATYTRSSQAAFQQDWGKGPPAPPLTEVPLAFTGCGVGRVWGKETSSFGVEPLIGCPCSRDVSTILHMHEGVEGNHVGKWGVGGMI